MDLNLDSLKRDIMAYLDTSEFAVFHSSPGGLEGLPLILWDSERQPDYRVFLSVANQLNVKLVLFASREFDLEEIQELQSEIEEMELDREDRRDYDTRLREARQHTGVTCDIEIAFEYAGRHYVYEVQPDWYEEFLTLQDEIMGLIAVEGGSGEDDSLGGYFSKN